MGGILCISEVDVFRYSALVFDRDLRLLYSVNKSCEIEGWAVFFVFLELTFFAVALWFLMEGIFGWDGWHVSHTLKRRSKNIFVKPIIIPELEFRNVKWHVFAATLARNQILKSEPQRVGGLEPKA